MNQTTAAALCAYAAATLALPQLARAGNTYAVTKTALYVQTGIGQVQPDPTDPYAFVAEAPVADTITVPNFGPSLSLVYDSGDSVYVLSRGYASQAAMDQSFPSGTYVFSGAGEPLVNVALTGDLYPPVPQITNGTWNANGQLVINPTTNLFLYFSDFPGFATNGIAGEFEFNVTDASGNQVVSYDQSNITDFPPFSYIMAAGTLSNGSTYTASIIYGTYVTLDDTTFINTELASCYFAITTFTIVAETVAAPVATIQPWPVTVAAGSTAVFSFNASGSPTPTYQWYFNSSPIPGATDSTLVVSGSTSANAGNYFCVATNSGGSTQSNSAQLSVASTSNPGRLINLSCRAQVGTGASVVIAGFVVGGSGTSGALPVLVRGSGPALGLAPFNVPGVLSDPKLTLNNVTASPNSLVTTDTGWGGSSAIASAASAVGAFPWSATSADSAALQSLSEDNYTAEISGAASDTGVALVEVYDATPAGTYTPTSPRLTNLSARVQVGTGANVVYAGFVIGGSTARTVLIRASGPSLAITPFSIPGTLPDPALTLSNVGVSPNVILATNTIWGGDTAIKSVAASVGAFPWAVNSNDSALLVTLPPGNYTAGVAGASMDTGVALVEVYEVE